MSFRYRVFGWPQNFDEFVDKIKRDGEKKVDVSLDEYVTDRDYGSTAYTFRLKAGKANVLMDDHLGYNSSQLEANIYIEILEGLGFETETKVHKLKDSDEIRKERLEGLRRKYLDDEEGDVL